MVKVACVDVGATGHFKLVADAIHVLVVQACPVTIVVVCGKRARPVVVGGCLVVVACRLVRATRHFQFVAHAVAVHVHQAVAVTIEVLVSISAGHIVFGGLGVVVASRLVGAPGDFLTDAVAVRVIQAVAIAIVERFWVRARTVVLGGLCVEIAGHHVRAAWHGLGVDGQGVALKREWDRVGAEEWHRHPCSRVDRPREHTDRVRRAFQSRAVLTAAQKRVGVARIAIVVGRQRQTDVQGREFFPHFPNQQNAVEHH